MRHSKTNHLATEKSLYLQQHAANPINWYPWGDEAFELAQHENKPVLLSSGYSTCHWCHVMSDEVFMDSEVADYLNEHFIAIKIDREERPDIDAIYMKVCQMLTGQAGWPLNVFLTAEQAPFYAATYIPKDDTHNQPGMMSIIKHLKRVYDEMPEQIEGISQQLIKGLADPPNNTLEDYADKEVVEHLYGNLRAQFDLENAGFGKAPKYPTSQPIQFLMNYSTRYSSIEADEMLSKTLEEWRYSALFDQIDGGFFRYTVDERHRSPHFEKMLYDQALLLDSYVTAYQYQSKELYKETSRRLIDFVDRLLMSENGVFHSAIDADVKGVEGAYYKWRWDEVVSVLGSETAVLFAYRFGLITQEQGAKGNILYVNERDSELRGNKLIDSLAKLSNHRKQELSPFVETKIKTSWNALMVKSLAKASRILGDQSYQRRAEDCFDALINVNYRDGNLYATSMEGVVKEIAFLDDYAYLIEACIELNQLTFKHKYIELAIVLANVLTEHFEDKQAGGFYFTDDRELPLIIRDKEGLDTALPNANASITFSFWQLSQLTNDSFYSECAKKTYCFFEEDIMRYPTVSFSWGRYLMRDICDAKVLKFRGEGALLLAKEYQKYKKDSEIWCVDEKGEGSLRLEFCEKYTCKIYEGVDIIKKFLREIYVSV
ncbi:MAG: thioredoxin domain-containing protein [Brochothrix sp.]|uniref:thioredoxin domain-containing protein n=1 Tax=Brochothrix sp. TaxID=1993875 RepID=UPI00257B0814|nr:thioredoxin domain-containing protein [Brochothrix sp.]MBR5525325.1 thioredoxin domain-containing protein [Brochothrix sp.]